MKIVIDENITYGKEAFEDFGEVTLLPGRAITNDALIDKEALFVRSVTNVNKDLLQNTNVRFIGTATIGKDHIDEKYLSENNIGFCYAAGCNSYAVTEYVFSAITHIAEKYNIDIESKSIGIIGYGNIGTKVAVVAEAIGMKVVLNDPPLQRKNNTATFSSLEEALSCDIVTFHVPLNLEGIDKTYHLLNEKNISIINDNTILINASRGAVIDNKVLKTQLEKGKKILTVLDVWEKEPDYDIELMKLVEIGTPHIAGYSFEGKVKGTTMIYRQFCEYLNKNPTWTPKPPSAHDTITDLGGKANKLDILTELFNRSYRVINDDSLMREAISFSREEKASHFHSLRKNYRLRRELINYHAQIDSSNKKNIPLLFSLRLNIVK